MNLSPEELARVLVEGRKFSKAFAKFPALVPLDLSYSYEVQEAAIGMWEDEIIGWKIGRLSPEAQSCHNTERLTGPIFKKRFWLANANVNNISIIDGGFAAVEAEFVFEIGRDAPIEKTQFSQNDAFELISSVYAGVEIAGSPIFDINSYGPTVVASDFGNNNGLILGNKIADINDIDQLNAASVKEFHAKSYVNAVCVGEGGLFSMPNGPLSAVAWLAGHLAQRGRPLKRGQFVSSGATTGIHDVFDRDSSQIDFEYKGANVSHFNIAISNEVI